jgi:chorismate synthase
VNIVVIGQKGAGKSAFGAALGDEIGLPVVEIDRILEEIHAKDHKRDLSCREIYKKGGEKVFRQFERKAAAAAAKLDWHIVVTGGGTFLDSDSRRQLRGGGALIVLLTAKPDALWQRATAEGIPPMFTGDGGRERFLEQLNLREEVYRPFADIVLDSTTKTAESLAKNGAMLIAEDFAIRARAANTFGDIVRVTSFGESHGKAIGCILDGIRPGIEIDEGILQEQLDRRRPGQSKVVTQRKEPDTVQILSGVFEGKTTGAPIGLIIYNQDADSRKYDEIRELFRPGHADFTFYKKYGLRDHRGGGRSSARETAMRVAAGAVAMHLLKQRGVRLYGHAVEIAGIRANTCDYSAIEQNPVRCADPEAAKLMEAAILDARKERDSVGGVIQLDILGVPPGLGDPIFAKLSSRLVYAISTIQAVKGIEIGDGFALTRMRGSEANDNMADGGFLSNHGGGIAGGISTGQPIRLRVAMKPTASIAQPQKTIDLAGKNRDIEVGGRHDPCIVPRAVPVIENMAALVILDAWEIQARLNPAWEAGLPRAT